MAEPLLTLLQVNTKIDRYHILHGVDLSVLDGKVLALLGRNGAGKTTTLRTIMGLWRACQGRILYEGRDITAVPTADIARAGIAYVPENMGIFGALTVAENMRLAARQGRPDSGRLEWIFGFFPALKRFWRLPAGHLSGGQKQMLSIARAVIEPRRLLLIDEPTKGIAPAVIADMLDAFRALKAGRTTMLLVEQNFHFAASLADQAAVMDQGRIVHTAVMAEFAADTELQTRLLGLSAGSSLPAPGH